MEREERNLSKKEVKVGDKFGRLEVIKFVGKDKNYHKFWICRCACGNTKIINGSNLLNGQTKSCGCLLREKSKENLKMANSARTLPEGEAMFNRLYSRMKKGAEERNLEWALSKGEVKKLISQPCFYCGALPSNHEETKRLGLNGDFFSNGLDRLDNNKGYLLSNVVPCCKICNFMKGSMNISEFKDFIIRVYNHITE